MFEFNNLSQNICCACLMVGENMQLMSPEQLELYKICVNELSSEVKAELYICKICAYLLMKFNKFMKQCQKAYSILNDSVLEDNKIGAYGPNLVYNLSKSEVSILEFTNYINEVDSLESVDIFDDFIDVDEEDIPLVMLKTEEDSGKNGIAKKKARKWKLQDSKETKANINLAEQENNFADIETENNIANFNHSNGEEKEKFDETEIKIEKDRKAKKKILREGFTSRMVQETDEYTVIRLTKEQVLKEMEENSKSEQYLRSLYKCEKCVKGFNFEDVLRTHLERHVKKKGWLLCDLCQQYCPSVVSLRGHMKSHTTRYKCKVCGCIRLSRQVVLEHHATCHTRVHSEYTCRVCEFVSNKRTSMQRHVRMRHKNTEKHPCEQCGKALNSIEALRVHMARHDKIKRLKCDECDRWFIYPSLLQRHKMAVHVRDDYYCVECDVKFKSRENLSLHFKRNKRHRDVSTFKYPCSACPARFMFSSELARHRAAAHAARPLAEAATSGANSPLICTQCNASFARKSLLRAHMRTHANECGETLAQPDTLTTYSVATHVKTTDEHPHQNQIPLTQNGVCDS